jgi:hypothetical protein
VNPRDSFLDLEKMEKETTGCKPVKEDYIHLSLLHIHPENFSPEFDLLWYPHSPPYEYNLVTVIQDSIRGKYPRHQEELLIW